ncbi:MAG: hypothetical protein KGI27_15590, partial [Thaumarchaeota archaeon]|nr:hypothetical protein [Nitrososphaerota archaeon]
MKTLHLGMIIIIIIGIIMISLTIVTSNHTNITVKTDFSDYANDQPITISGKVFDVNTKQPILIQVLYSNGKFYKSSEIQLINNTSLYSYNFQINPLHDGTYDFTVKAMYD